MYHSKKRSATERWVRLIKEPDKEAIRVELKGPGKIGYVENSPYTVIGESKNIFITSMGSIWYNFFMKYCGLLTDFMP